MVGLIFKASYNKIGDNEQQGGVCGSCFFISPKIVVTANHVLNKHSFKPNPGYKFCQYWIFIDSNTVVELSIDLLWSYPDIDTTFIKLKTAINIPLLSISNSNINLGDNCYNKGFIASCAPAITGMWMKNKLLISKFNSENCAITGNGKIIGLRKASVASSDINLKDVDVIQLSYSARVGMSGGPLVLTNTNKVIGLMSFGLPMDVPIKTTCLAIDIKQIVAKL